MQSPSQSVQPSFQSSSRPFVPPVRAVVMDMDGTLLNEHNQITEKTRDYLIGLEKQGIQLILASGRSYTRLLDYAHQLKMDEYGGYLIEIDGVALYDLHKQKRTKYHEMQPEEIREVFTWLTGQPAESQAMFDNGLFDYYPSAFQAIKEKIRKKENLPDDFPWTAGPWSWLTDFRDGYPDIHYVQSADEIDRPINKIQIMQEEEPLEVLYQNLMNRFSESFSIYRTTPRQLEILPAGYSKGAGVQKLMEKEGWKPEEVIVFGDGENDCSMFETVPYSFAMGNARDYVKKRAWAVAPSNREDGIVEALKSLGLQETDEKPQKEQLPAPSLIPDRS